MNCCACMLGNLLVAKVSLCLLYNRRKQTKPSVLCHQGKLWRENLFKADTCSDLSIEWLCWIFFLE